MNRAIAHVAAAIALALAVVVTVMPVAAFAKDLPGTPSGRPGNPGNHYGEISNPGHHYGQLKHQQPPTPNPTPDPAPSPAPNPGHNPSTPLTTGVTAGHSQGAGTGAPGSSGVSDVIIGIPAQNRAQNATATEIPASGGDLEWLLLLVLPSLLAIWVIVAAGILRKAFKRRSAAAPVLASSPTA